MGANMARRLKDRGFHVTSVYDTNRGAATELASELGCAAAQDLSEVTAASDVIFTVVTDDDAMRKIFGDHGTGHAVRRVAHRPDHAAHRENQRRRQGP